MVTPYLDRNRSLRLTTLCVLYAAQGVPDGFVRIALKNYLIDQKASLEAIGTVVAMVSWPWAMKWVWGPFIDRFGYAPMGRRRPWILLAQLLMAATLVAMLMIPDLTANLRLLALMVLLVNIFASLQDVSVDALAVDLLSEKERGAANGFMYASSNAGTYVGGWVVGGLLLAYGLSAAVGTQVGILLAIVAFPFFLRERPGDWLLPRPKARAVHHSSATVARPSSLGQVFKTLFRAFSLRSTLLAAVLALLSLIAVNGHLLFWPEHVQGELGWTAKEWLALEGGWGAGVALGGAVAGGLIASALGAKRTVMLSLLAMSLCWFAYPWTVNSWDERAVVRTLFLVETALANCLQVSMFALFMGICLPTVAATQFTAYMAMLNLSNGFGAKLAGPIKDAFGVVDAHVALGCLHLALVAVAWAIDPYETRRKFAATNAAGNIIGVGDSRSPEIIVIPPEPPPRY